MTIANLLQDRDGTVHSCTADDRVAAVVATLAQRRIGALPVMDAGQVVGIVSERDILYCLSDQGAAVMELSVREVMTGPAVTVELQTPVLSALSLMTRRRIRHLPVVSQDRMIGFVSIGDLVKYRIDRIESEAEAMRSYIQTA